jgi:hypothetical protein
MSDGRVQLGLQVNRQQVYIAGDRLRLRGRYAVTLTN